MEESKNSMKKFREFIMKLADHNPEALPLIPSPAIHIEGLLNKFLSGYETPDHPPYPAMVERAIRELGEKEGSCLESISEFLQKEYSKLPWAHLLLLERHLGKLCESGDIVKKHDDRYMLGDINLRSKLCERETSSEIVSKQGQITVEGRQERCRKQDPIARKVRGRLESFDEEHQNKRRRGKILELAGAGKEEHMEGTVAKKTVVRLRIKFGKKY